MGVSRLVTVKKRCCDDRPRCRSCPYVWERLASCGWADAVARRRFVVRTEVPTDVMKLARKGKARPLRRPG
jgi:hypothetical protein